MIKVGGIQNTQVLWQAVFLAASPLASSGSAAKTFFRARLQYRQLRRLNEIQLSSFLLAALVGGVEAGLENR